MVSAFEILTDTARRRVYDQRHKPKPKHKRKESKADAKAQAKSDAQAHACEKLIFVSLCFTSFYDHLNHLVTDLRTLSFREALWIFRWTHTKSSTFCKDPTSDARATHAAAAKPEAQVDFRGLLRKLLGAKKVDVKRVELSALHLQVHDSAVPLFSPKCINDAIGSRSIGAFRDGSVRRVRTASCRWDLGALLVVAVLVGLCSRVPSASGMGVFTDAVAVPMGLEHSCQCHLEFGPPPKNELCGFFLGGVNNEELHPC